MLYHVSRNGQNYGPYTLEDLQRYVSSGNVLPTDLAKSDEMPDWIPVSQVLGVAMPSASTPVPAFGAPVAGYPAAASAYPDPPNLHWALVLLIGFFTCGLFMIVWMFVQASWMRKVNPRSKALTYYIAAMAVYVVLIVAEIAIAAASANGGSPNSGLAVLTLLLSLAYFVLYLVAIFTMRSEIEEHFNGPEPIGLSLSGVMTFFFNVLYFQYHFTRINELKRGVRYGGAAV